MRMSRHLGTTIKETPSEAQIVSHQLLLRAGYIRQVMAGIYNYLPLMYRVLMKVSQIVREEMNKKGAQELLMPALQPKELWEESGRWERYTELDGIMFAFEDRRKSMVCLGPTHEEVITDIARREITSAKQLPVNLYQIQSKFRDEIRPRFGLLRTREFIMKDAYSFDKDQAGLDKSFDDMFEAYTRICERTGLNFRSVEADAGAIGGSGSREFMVLAETGEDTILYCTTCEYAANQEKAESRLEKHEEETEMRPMEAVLGEGVIGVDNLAKHLGVTEWHITKTLLYQADDVMVAVMVRGDSDVNEIKLQNFLNCKTLTLASSEMVKKVTGAETGYAGPVNLPAEVKVLADLEIQGMKNFECGGNQTNYHNINVNFGRDFEVPVFADFKVAVAGHACPKCDEGKLAEARGIEVGHIFKLGTKYSEALKCNFQDEQGQEQAMVMGCYGIGVSRLAASAIEQNHDERGIIWPIAMAPYHIHLAGLNLEQDEIRKAVDEVYEQLMADEFEVFYDDRDARPGEKFADADLIGLPFRITISKKTIEQGKVEFKRRKDKEATMLDLAEAVGIIRKEIEGAEVPKIYLG